MQLGSLGSAVSSPNGAWGGAPAEIEFGAILSLQYLVAAILLLFYFYLHKLEAPLRREAQGGGLARIPDTTLVSKGSNIIQRHILFNLYFNT